MDEIFERNTMQALQEKTKFAEFCPDIDHRFCIAMQPVEVDGMKFRMSLSFIRNVLHTVAMAAEPDLESGKSRKEIHNEWLRKKLGGPSGELPYGDLYEQDGIRIVSEHEDLSGTDVITITYPKEDAEKKEEIEKEAEPVKEDEIGKKKEESAESLEKDTKDTKKSA